MKICQFNVPALTGIGGIETDIIALSNFLVKEGIDVSIVAGSGKQIVELNSKIKVFSYPFLNRKNWLNKILSKIYPKLLSNYQIECLSFWPLAFIHFLRNDYDIIHFHQPVDAIFFNFLKHFKKFKTVLTIHGYPTKTLVNSMKKTNLIISVSNYSKKHMQKLGLESIVVYNPINLKKFQNIKNSALIKKFELKNKFVLMSVGRLVDWKGIHFIIKAMPLILKQNKNVKYLIVGSGEHENELKKLAKELNLENYVHFLGIISQKRVPKYLALCDIFLQPSIQWEALGMGIVEAMSAGKPVISTNMGGVKELIENNKTGFLVEPKNEKAIAEKVIELMQKPVLRKKLSENGKKKIDLMFDEKKLIEKIINAYQRILKQ